jgi:hypothetical protein
MKPCRPVSANSTVYEYFTPATPLAQSSDPPAARSSNKVNQSIFYLFQITDDNNNINYR